MYRSGTRCARYGTSRCLRGFTLIELMVSLVVVAILVAIAVPSYSMYVRQARRGEAESTLADIAQREQQYFLDQRAYAANIATLNPTIPSDVQTYYTVTATPGAGAPPTFVATAAPKAGTAQARDYTLTIDNTGAKTPAGVW